MTRLPNCSGCGSNLFVQVGHNRYKCEYCGSEYIVEEHKKTQDELMEQARIYAEEQYNLQERKKVEKEELDFLNACKCAVSERKTYRKKVLITILVGIVILVIILNNVNQKFSGVFAFIEIFATISKLIRLRKDYGEALDWCDIYKL